MLLLGLGLALFIAVHLVPTAPELRKGLAASLGEGSYKAIFSVLSLAGLVLIVIGFNGAKFVEVWQPSGRFRHVAMTLMLPVFPLLVMAYLPGTWSAAIRHPMVAALKIWAFAHLLVRGELKSMLMFGALLAFAVYDRISLVRRERAGLVRIRSGPARNNWIAVAVGLAIYAFFVARGHLWLTGFRLVP